MPVVPRFGHNRHQLGAIEPAAFPRRRLGALFVPRASTRAVADGAFIDCRVETASALLGQTLTHRAERSVS